MARFPLRNVGPAAEPWAREMQNRLETAERELAQLRSSNDTTDQMQATQLKSLTDKQRAIELQQALLKDGVDGDGWQYETYTGSAASFTVTRTLSVPTWAKSALVTAQVNVEGTLSHAGVENISGSLYLQLKRDPDPASIFLEVGADGVQLPGQAYYIGGFNSRTTKIEVMDMTTLYADLTVIHTDMPAMGKYQGFNYGLTVFWRVD